MKLYDMLYMKSENDHFRKAFETATVIDATPVSDYYYSETPQEFWDMPDFPTIAPSFDRMYFEFTAPKTILSETAGVRPWRKEDPTGWGMGVGSFLATEESIRRTSHGAWQGFEEYLIQNVVGAKWCMDFWLYLQHKDEVEGPVWVWRFLIDEQGKPVQTSTGDYVCIEGAISEKYIKLIDMYQEKLGKKEGRLAVYTTVVGCLHTTLLAISFMHCKNVVFEDVHPRKVVPHNKAQIKRGVQPYQPVSYKTIHIHPMKAVLKKTAQEHHTTTQGALRICRGYFRTYTEEGKLFGKYVGKFWTPERRVGNIQNGLNINDYTVHAE